jgi:hypothetical protein
MRPTFCARPAAARHLSQTVELEKQAAHFGHPTVGIDRDE